jgi:alpha-tubulin suppressor-like RCC1 family protein
VHGFGVDRRAVKSACGEKFTVVLQENGEVYCFGKQPGTDECLFKPKVFFQKEKLI